MANQNTKIEIPERLENEEPATSEQLQFIRQLVSGQSLQGYRFDYRKLGKWQASAIIDQLIAIRDARQQPAPTKPRKQGPGCIASLAKGTTALIVWLIVLAGVAGGAYLIYWQMNQAPKNAESTDENPFENEQANRSPDADNNPGRKTPGSTIFEGLGVSDNDPAPPDTPTKQPNTPTTEPTPRPEPVAPPTPTIDRELAQQLKDLEEMLVSLSQYTRSDFAADLRVRSAEGMQTKLAAFPQALSALKAIDPTLPPRINAVIDAFAAPSFDGPRLREEIKAIRDAFPDPE